MPIISLPNPGSIGLVQDIPPAELPAGAWSEVRNVRFKQGSVQSMPSDQVLQTVPYQPEWCLSIQGALGSTASWVLASDQKAYSLEGQTLTDITPPAVTSLPQDGLNWSGGGLGMVTVLHNAMDAPWAWLSPNPATKMVLLANWPAGMKAYTLRSFKQYLIALQVTKGASYHPTMVKWSHPADPGTVPVSWDETDPTRDAGEYSLSETPGKCIDCVSMKDLNIIYKQDSVWGMQYIGGTYIFKFFKIFGDFGMPVRGCAAEYSSGKHFVFTGTDLVTHDGNSSKSIADGKVKKMLSEINEEQMACCFVTLHPAQAEVWFCLRRGPATKYAADTAIIWNWQENTLTIRDLPDYRYIAPGRVDSVSSTQAVWATNTATWDTAGVVWAEYADIPAFQRLLGLGDMNLNWVDGLSQQKTPILLERTYVGFPVKSNAPPDLSCRKFVRRVWPRFTGATGTRLYISFGTADSVAESIKWRAPKLFVIGVTRKSDITLSGKVMAMRVTEDPATAGQFVWKYSGMDIDIEAEGEN